MWLHYNSILASISRMGATPMLLGSIRSRLLGLVLATVVPFAGLIGFGLWNQWRSDHAEAVRRASDEARLLAAQVDDHINNLDNLVVALSLAVSWDAADASANDDLLHRVKAELPANVANLLLFATDGSNIGTSSDAIRFNASDRGYFQRVLAGEGRAIGDVIRSRGGAIWVVNVARPVHDRAGQLRAVLSIGTKLEHLQDTLRVAGLLAGSVVRIVNENGIVVAQTDTSDWIGRDLSADESVARHIAAEDIGEIVAWPDRVQRITGSATAHEVPWVVSVGLPTDLAFARIFWRLVWGALITLAVLVIAFFIAWALSGRIVRPLRQLQRDASVLAGGDLSHRTAVRTGDEVGVLAEAFNQMAGRIEYRRGENRRAADDLRRTKDTLAAVIDASPVALVCSDSERRVILWNHSAQALFGYCEEEVLGKCVNLVPPRAAGESVSLFERTLRGETIRDVQMQRMRKDGSLVDVRATSARMYNADGSIRGVARAYEDITERKRAEAQLERIAHYDQLTGLPNRLTLQKELGRLLSRDGGNRPNAIALFDLDGFKDVNDTLGHTTGDQLLIEVGHRLKDMAHDRGDVCRLGGDEFVVILPDCGDPIAIGELVGAMLNRLTEPFTINDHVLHLAGSAGVAIAPADGRSVDELIANADLALYQAKSEGGRICRFFLPVLRAQAQARRSLDLELRSAFARDEFVLHFQPQIRLWDEAVVGAEALIRWQHPIRGLLAPGAFIDTLAASAIAPEVSRWIIRTACENISRWRAAGLPLGRMGVNLFPSQLADESLLKDIDDALQATGLPADALELEITENVALNFERATVLQKLREKGVKLAFDDFGTGYASLSYLTKFPLARIKIDRSFVAKISDDAGDTAIVRSLIVMAHNLGLEVIAEGVETRSQAEFLRNERCEEAQGYLYAKPLPAAEFEAYLRTRRLLQAVGAEDRPAHEDVYLHSGGKHAARRRAPTA
jgi:diguanylate cyclase (GGDEF)-like protein/PAS domain S-box-containing protein